MKNQDHPNKILKKGGKGEKSHTFESLMNAVRQSCLPLGHTLVVCVNGIRQGHCEVTVPQ